MYCVLAETCLATEQSRGSVNTQINKILNFGDFLQLIATFIVENNKEFLKFWEKGLSRKRVQLKNCKNKQVETFEARWIKLTHYGFIKIYVKNLLANFKNQKKPNRHKLKVQAWQFSEILIKSSGLFVYLPPLDKIAVMTPCYHLSIYIFIQKSCFLFYYFIILSKESLIYIYIYIKVWILNLVMSLMIQPR